MALDTFVKARLGDRGIVHFAVPVAAISDQVNHHVGIKLGAIFRREPPDTHHGVGVFGVDVENWDALAARDARGVA